MRTERGLRGTTFVLYEIYLQHDCVVKTQLFMGNRLRVHNQQKKIQEMHAQISNDCLQNGESHEYVVLI